MGFAVAINFCLDNSVSLVWNDIYGKWVCCVSLVGGTKGQVGEIGGLREVGGKWTDGFIWIRIERWLSVYAIIQEHTCNLDFSGIDMECKQVF